MSYMSLDDIKDFLKIDDTDYDDQLELYYPTLIETMERYLGRKLTQETYIHESYRPCTSIIHLNNYPVISLTSINVDGTDVDLADYYVNVSTGSLHGDFMNGEIVIITYEGGYDPIPGPINGVLIGLIENAYETLVGASDSDVKDVTLFDFAKVTFDTASSSNAVSYQGVGSGVVPAVLEDYLGVLNMYRSSSVLINTGSVG